MTSKTNEETTHLIQPSLNITSVNDQVSREGSKRKIWRSFFASFMLSFGPFLSGYCLGYSSPVQSLLVPSMMSNNVFAIFSSIINIGAALGAFYSMFLNDFIGRKYTAIVSLISWCIGWLLLGVTDNIPCFMIGRIVTGIGLGMNTSVIPLYMSEIAPAKYRGQLGTLFQIMVNVGILAAYIAGIFLNNGKDYKWIGLIGLGFTLFALMPLILQHRSPVWLVYKGRQEEAIKALQFFNGQNFPIENELEVAESLAELKKQRYNLSVIFTKQVGVPLIVSFALVFFQQFTGIDFVLFYCSKIAGHFHIGLTGNQISVIPAIIFVLVSFLSSFVVDLLGRKLLLIIASIGMCISSLTIGTYFIIDEKVFFNCSIPSYHNEHIICNILPYISIIGLCGFFCFFAFAWGPVPWIYSAEILSVKWKNITIAMVTQACRISTLIVTLGFPYYEIYLVQLYGTFFTLAAINILALIFIILFVKETKGKSLDDIQKLYT